VTPATQAVVAAALDQALAVHVAKLYSVLVTSGEANGLGRFWTGLNRAIGAHEELKATIEADDQCIAPASSGS
jgi:hypothetical protein